MIAPSDTMSPLHDRSHGAEGRRLTRYARDPHVGLFAIGVAILTYGVELSGFTLSIDEELHAYNARPGLAWAAQGRWAMGLLSDVLPPLSATPFLPTVLFCAGLVLAALVLAGGYARSRAEACAFAGIFVSCPIWLHVAEFNTLSWGFGVGLAVAAVGTALLHPGGPRAAILGGAVTGLALGIYQSLLLVVVCGSLLGVAVRWLDGARSGASAPVRIPRDLGWLVVSWSLSLLIYYGAAAAALSLTRQDLVYVDTYVRLGELVSPATMATAVSRMAGRLAGLLFGTDPTFLGWGIASLLVVWLGAALALFSVARADAHDTVTRVCAILAVVGAALVSLAPVIGSAGVGPLRALPALPLLYAAGAGAAMKASWKAPQWALLALAVFVNAWVAATLFNAEAIARDRDRVMAGRVFERIAALGTHEAAEPRAFVVVGEWAHEAAGPARRVEVFGASFFEHDGGNPYRVVSYLRLLGLRGLRPEPITHLRAHLGELEALPTWPANGSVALVAGKLVLKLGPPSYAQRVALSR